MNTVQPIRSKTLVNQICKYLKEKNERDYVLFMVGIHTGLRISDILPLQIKDVRGKKYIYMREKKTGKEREIELHKNLRLALKDYINKKEDWEYLFPSRQRASRTSKIKEIKPLTRHRVNQILYDVASEFNIQNIGTHTMRKTFGYTLYKCHGKDIATIQQIFNHSNQIITMRYIGIDQDRQNALISELSYT